MDIKVKGILDFYPINRTKKHDKQASWKKVAIVKTDCDLDRYYAWFLTKRFGLTLNKNLRGPHVTFINDIVDFKQYNECAKMFQGRELGFNINTNDIRSNGSHWWFKVDCPEAESIREILGLTREPYFGMHFTIGHAVEKNIEHSEYIWRCINRFGV